MVSAKDCSLSERSIDLRKFVKSLRMKAAILGWKIAYNVDNGKLSLQEV